MSEPAIVIVGTGQAGLQVAASLRERGHGGRIVMVGEEEGLPYQRPPLSKGYLAGSVEPEALLLRQPGFFQDRGVELRDGQRVVALDRGAAQIVLGTGERLAYDHLVLATGARDRRLAVPGADLPGVLSLRTRTEADTVREALGKAGRVCIVGGGFIGLELAAAALARGAAVDLVEIGPRLLGRAVSPAMAQAIRAGHLAAGLGLHLGTSVDGIESGGGRALAVQTRSGQRILSDLVLVGIGVVPNVDLAAESGLEVGDGILVDAQLRTSDPRISAVGDCVAFVSRFAGGMRVRLESVQNAVDQARCVAARLTGAALDYDAVPWFWSDQGKMRLQIVGLAAGHDHTVVRGEPERGPCSIFCFAGDRLLAVESLNRPGDHMIARRLMAAGALPTPAQVADAGFDLKAMLADSSTRADRA